MIIKNIKPEEFEKHYKRKVHIKYEEIRKALLNLKVGESIRIEEEGINYKSINTSVYYWVRKNDLNGKFNIAAPKGEVDIVLIRRRE